MENTPLVSSLAPKALKQKDENRPSSQSVPFDLVRNNTYMCFDDSYAICVLLVTLRIFSIVFAPKSTSPKQ